jgi:competence protein ComEA
MIHARKQHLGTLRAPRGFAPGGAVAALAALLCVAALAASAVAETPSAPAAVAAVDINAASADQLMSLPGIGASKAQAIVKYRDEHGPYHAPEDLLEVKGIGESLLRKIQPHITVGGAKANR